MSKDKSEISSVGWTYKGVEEDWDGFDRRMIRFMQKKLDSFGERLWMGGVPELKTLSKVKYTEYVLGVYQAIRITQPREAKDDINTTVTG
jgi:hypothetical protein